MYTDVAETGTKNARPEFRRLISDCRVGHIDLVLTKFDERLRLTVIDTATVGRGGMMTFRFKNGLEITA
jgi:DNA invertase Pin-like site-specific DNA recombinase